MSWRQNNSFISLVPKREVEKRIGDYHPLILLLGAYKILAKALASRLKVVMRKIIAEFQMVGVEGRLIQEKVLIANELLDSKFMSGRPDVICKIDFSKAFGHVSWEFLAYILGGFGFGLK